MPATYANVLEHLRTLSPELLPAPGGAPRKFDLDHMRVLMGALGDPQESYQAMLIAGTNGKGSTAATLASILTSAGVNTGLYTSPHLVRVNERMQHSVATMPTEYSTTGLAQTRGEAELRPIGDDDFARLYVQVDTTAEQLVAAQKLPHPPSFFERVTAVAMLWFAECSLQVAVLEVGLGGRLDATNIVEPLVSILTDISLDHQEYLGSSLAAITKEKAGILRQHGTLLTLPQHPEVNQTLGEIAATMPDLRALSAVDYMPPTRSEPARTELTGPPGTGWEGPLPRNRYTLQLADGFLEVDSPLAGQHQQRNIALAIGAADCLRITFGYDIPLEAIARGIRRTQWPGRLEGFTYHRRLVILDVAHNPAGAWTLRMAIAQLDAARPRTLLFSCLRDKDLKEMAQILFPLFDGRSTDLDRQGDHLVLAPVDSPRAAHVDDLLREAHRLEIPAHASPHLHAALAQAIEITPEDGYVVVTGSVYLVGQVRSLIGERS